MIPDPLGHPTPGRGGLLEERDRSRRAAKPLLIGLLLAIIFAVFGLYAASDTDWEVLTTKHYWSAREWYYGGFGWQITETLHGYRTLQKEGLGNYSNLFLLRETGSAKESQYRVQGYPGTERLGVPFLLYLFAHLTGPKINIWSEFWLVNVLLWLATIFLTYRIAALFYVDGYAPWFAAILVTAYPAWLLTFNGIKLQPLGTTYLLLGIYVFERHLSPASIPRKIVGLTALLFIGMFANGGWFFIGCYVFFRAWWLQGSHRWITIGALLAAGVLAKLWLGTLAHAYQLPSAEEQMGFSLGRMVADSRLWLHAWRTNQNISGLKFLGYRGATFFTGFLPLIGRIFAVVHAPLLVLALLGAWIEPRSRLFVFLTIPMLFSGHTGNIMGAYIYHYGYMSFPAGVMVILAAAGGLNWLFTRRGRWGWLLALIFIVYADGGFLDVKKQAGFYYGGDPATYGRRLYIYYGDEPGHLTY
jgi:hypothetical protein